MSPTKWFARRARPRKISTIFSMSGDRRSRFPGKKISSTKYCRWNRFTTILINLYRDNQYSLQWVDKLKVPVHVRSEAEYVDLLKKHAFENVEARRIPDDTPTPDGYKTKSFHSLEELRAFKRMGALLLMATKPDLRTPAPGYTIY